MSCGARLRRQDGALSHSPHVGGAKSFEVPPPPASPREFNLVALPTAGLDAADIVWEGQVRRFGHHFQANLRDEVNSLAY